MWPSQEPGDGGLLDDQARVQHDGPLAELANHPEVMGDQQQRHLPVAHQ